MIIKAGFHLHTADDPHDHISYTSYEAIDRAAALGFGALAITCHRKVAWSEEYAAYARFQGILLVPGIEAKIEGRDVVILNCDTNAGKIATFADLRRYRSGHPFIFVIAPHPFLADVFHLLRPVSLGRELSRHIDLFDAVELTVFSNKYFDFNKKAAAAARAFAKPLIATADAHRLSDIGRGYALVDAEEKTATGIFAAVRAGKAENRLAPMGVPEMLSFRAQSLLSKLAPRRKTGLAPRMGEIRRASLPDFGSGIGAAPARAVRAAEGKEGRR